MVHPFILVEVDKGPLSLSTEPCLNLVMQLQSWTVKLFRHGLWWSWNYDWENKVSDVDSRGPSGYLDLTFVVSDAVAVILHQCQEKVVTELFKCNREILHIFHLRKYRNKICYIWLQNENLSNAAEVYTVPGLTIELSAQRKGQNVFPAEQWKWNIDEILEKVVLVFIFSVIVKTLWDSLRSVLSTNCVTVIYCS